MWKSFENIGLQTSEKVSWEKNKKETCVKHKIDRSQNGRSNNTQISIYRRKVLTSEAVAEQVS